MTQLSTPSNENKSKHQNLNNNYHQEKASSKDSAYGFSGGETSRLGNPHTREPTPEERAGDSARYKRPNSRYSSNGRYRRYHRIRESKDARIRHTSSSRSDDERFPERNQNQLIQRKLIHQQLQSR